MVAPGYTLELNAAGEDFFSAAETNNQDATAGNTVNCTGQLARLSLVVGDRIFIAGYCNLRHATDTGTGRTVTILTQPEGPTITREHGSIDQTGAAAGFTSAPVGPFIFSVTQDGLHTVQLSFKNETGAGALKKILSQLTVYVYKSIQQRSSKTFLSKAQPRPMGRGQDVLDDRGPFAPSP